MLVEADQNFDALIGGAWNFNSNLLQTFNDQSHVVLISLLDIFLKLCQDLIEIFFICKEHQNIYFFYLYVQWFVELTIENLEVLGDQWWQFAVDYFDVFEHNELELRPLNRKQGGWIKLVPKGWTIFCKIASLPVFTCSIQFTKTLIVPKTTDGLICCSLALILSHNISASLLFFGT